MARDYEPDRRGMAALLRSAEVQEVCMRAAEDLAARVRVVTPTDTGETAASTRAEPDRGPGGLVGAKVVQDGAAVPVNWGNSRTRAQHHLDRALGGLS